MVVVRVVVKVDAKATQSCDGVFCGESWFSYSPQL
jgi:hypothetical protein